MSYWQRVIGVGIGACLGMSMIACESETGAVALGTLERDRIAHSATQSEVVIALPVAQGSLVKKGTVLVQLDDTGQQARVAQARAELEQAEANLEKLRNGAREEEVAAAQAQVRRYEAELAGNQANYSRIQNLSKKGLASKAERDQLLAARDASRANLQSTVEHLKELTNGTRIEDLRMAQANLDGKKASLANELKLLADLTVVATRDGVLDNLPWNLGERVTSGSPLAVVLAGKSPFARVYVPEPYRVKLKIGDSLVVKVDGLDRDIEGRLRWISDDPAFTPYYALNQQERARLVYLAEVQLPDSSSELPNGLPVQVMLQ